MASEIKIKDEPVDRGYEKVCPELSAVKQEPQPSAETQATDSDDDFAWVNAELDFLNDIDALVEDSNPAPDSSSQTNNAVTVKQEPGLSAEESQVRVSIKLESGGTTEVAVQPDLVSETANSRLANSADLGSSSEGTTNAETATSTEVNAPINDSAQSLATTNNQSDSTGGSEDVTNKNSAEIRVNGLLDSSVESLNNRTPAASFFFPVRVKQEKISPPREIPPVPADPIPSLPPLPPEPSNPPASSQPPLPPETVKSPAPPLPGMPVPIIIKQERVSPPPPEAPPKDVDPSTARKRQTESPPRPVSPKRQKSQTSPSPSKTVESPNKIIPGLDADLAFLQMQRQKIAKELQKQARKSRFSKEPPTTSVSNLLPVPIKIKTEPREVNTVPVDMEIDNDVPEDPSYVSQDSTYVPKDSMYVPKDSIYVPKDSTYVPNPLALKLMPQPLKVKEEPFDSYEVNVPQNVPLRPIKVERNDDRPMSHRERVIKFAKETLRNIDLFERTPKLQRRFLYTPVVLVRENAEKLTENRSPLNSTVGIQYEFSSTKHPVNTERFGVCKLSDLTSKVVRILGFNAYEFTNKIKSHKLEKLDEDEPGQDPNEQTAYFVNASCQTDELKCNRCIVRKLKKYVDRGIQVSLGPSRAAPVAANPSYDNVSGEMLETISQLAPAQHTALMEFAELILGPAPSNTNDVGRMREKLMDIFTLAQSRRDDSAKSNSSANSNITPTSVLFNQPERPQQTIKPLFPSMASPQEQRDSSPHGYQQNHHSNYNPMQGTSQQQQPIQSLGYQHQQQPAPVPNPYSQQNQIYPPQMQPQSVPAPVPAPYNPNFPPPEPLFANAHQVDPRTMMSRPNPMMPGIQQQQMAPRPLLPSPHGIYRPGMPQKRDPRSNNMQLNRLWEAYP